MNTYIVLENRERLAALVAFSREYVKHQHTVRVERVTTNTRHTTLQSSELPPHLQSQYEGNGPVDVRFHDNQSLDVYNVDVGEIPPLTRERAQVILEAFVRESLSNILAYQKPISALHMTACALHNTHYPTEIQLLNTEHFITEDVVDELHCEVMLEVEHHVGIGSWNEWYAVRTSHLVGLINTNQDHRIREWERQQAYQIEMPPEGEFFGLDDVVNHISTQIRMSLGHYPPLGHLYEIVMGAIARLTGNIIFVNEYDIPLANPDIRLQQYERFYEDVIEWTVRGFMTVQVSGRLKPMARYHAMITPQGQLHLTEARSGIVQDHAHYRDLCMSLENGDWIPERDRRWLEEYERR